MGTIMSSLRIYSKAGTDILHFDKHLFQFYDTRFSIRIVDMY